MHNDTSFIVTMLWDLATVVRDVAPIIVVVFFFQFVILRKAIPHFKTVLIGLGAVVLGLWIFLIGLEMGVFPVGEALAIRFARPGSRETALLFAFCIGYASTIAEPALLAVAQKAEEITAGGVKSFALRNAVALGVALGLTTGVWRIFAGDPLWVYIFSGYVIALALTAIAPKEIIPLAYDSGGVTTSTITVPLVAALGLGLATNIPGRDPLIDGFGLIAFASVAPMITVLSYAIIIDRKNKSLSHKEPR